MNETNQTKVITFNALGKYEKLRPTVTPFMASYATMKEMQQLGKLIPGQLYRITDYVTTTTQADTQSAGHQFDIMVVALNETTLSEEAWAIQHDGDTYFKDSRLEAWQLKYRLDNEDVTESGKGTITWMKDEWGNEAAYDFKNIQQKRWKVTDELGRSSIDGKYLGVLNNLPEKLSIEDESDFIWAYLYSVYNYAGGTQDTTDHSLTGNVYEMVANFTVDSNNAFVWEDDSYEAYKSTFYGSVRNCSFFGNIQNSIISGQLNNLLINAGNGASGTINGLYTLGKIDGKTITVPTNAAYPTYAAMTTEGQMKTWNPADSLNPIESLGAYDISAAHASGGVLATYADLTSALGTNGANIPEGIRKGGMSVKFVLSSDNKYVQYRFLLSVFNASQFADVSKWQGVDITPVEGSNNLVESKGVFGKVSANKVAQSIGINKRFDLEFVQQKRIGTDGSYSSAGVSANVYASPEYIPVKEGQTLYLYVHAPGATDVCAWYDDDFNFVSSFKVRNTKDFPRTVTIPSGCSYLRVSNEYPTINEPYVELLNDDFLSNKELKEKINADIVYNSKIFINAVESSSPQAVEEKIRKVIAFITIYGQVSKSSRYVIRDITRNRNSGYELVLSTIKSDGTYEKGEVFTCVIPSSEVVESDDVTIMKFSKYGVTVIAGIRYKLIEDGGILNANGIQHYIINPEFVQDAGAINNPSFIKYVDGLPESAEGIFLESIKDIHIEVNSDNNSLYGFRQMTRARNGMYELMLSTLDEHGSATGSITFQKPTNDVNEINGVGNIVFKKNDTVVDIVFDFNSIEIGGIVRNDSHTYHYFINPLKINKLTSKNVMLQLGEISATIRPKYNKRTYKYIGQLNPSKRYISFGFDDFRDSDFSLIMPVFERHDYKATFNKIVRSLNATNSDIQKLDNLFNGEHELGDHTFQHQQYIFTDPMFNGQNPDSPEGSQIPYPSNDQMRNDRGDGKNVFGVGLDTTVKSKLSYGPSAISQDRTWRDLTDAECQLIRNRYSVMQDTDTNVIKMFDEVWNRLYGTTGSSRGSWDSTTQKYTGGIFTGKSTSANHEIWERICVVVDYYYKKYLNLNYNFKVWSLPGDKRSNLYFENGGKYYYDSNFTQYANYNAQINGRSWTEVLRAAGYSISHDYMQPGRVDGTGRKAIMEQFILNTDGRRKDGLLYCSSQCHDYVYTEIETAYNDSSTYKTAKDLYDSSDVTVFKRIIEDIRRKMSNGLVPMETTDSLDTYSMKVFHNAILDYCKATGVEVLTRSEVLDLCFNHTFGCGNLIYNPTFRNTAKEFMPTANVPDNPDGYNGQCSVSIVNDIPVLITSGETVYLHYGIPTGSIKYSADVLGTGSISIYAIKNSTARDLSDATLMDTITINNVDYSNEDTVLNIPNNPLTQYEQIYEGYGNKIIGIKIVYSAGLSVKNIVLQRT